MDNSLGQDPNLNNEQQADFNPLAEPRPTSNMASIPDFSEFLHFDFDLGPPPEGSFFDEAFAGIEDQAATAESETAIIGNSDSSRNTPPQSQEPATITTTLQSSISPREIEGDDLVTATFVNSVAATTANAQETPAVAVPVLVADSGNIQDPTTAPLLHDAFSAIITRSSSSNMSSTKEQPQEAIAVVNMSPDSMTQEASNMSPVTGANTTTDMGPIEQRLPDFEFPTFESIMANTQLSNLSFELPDPASNTLRTTVRNSNTAIATTAEATPTVANLETSLDASLFGEDANTNFDFLLPDDWSTNPNAFFGTLNSQQEPPDNNLGNTLEATNRLAQVLGLASPATGTVAEQAGDLSSSLLNSPFRSPPGLEFDAGSFSAPPQGNTNNISTDVDWLHLGTTTLQSNDISMLEELSASIAHPIPQIFVPAPAPVAAEPKTPARKAATGKRKRANNDTQGTPSKHARKKSDVEEYSAITPISERHDPQTLKHMRAKSDEIHQMIANKRYLEELQDPSITKPYAERYPQYQVKQPQYDLLRPVIERIKTAPAATGLIKSEAQISARPSVFAGLTNRNTTNSKAPAQTQTHVQASRASVVRQQQQQQQQQQQRAPVIDLTAANVSNNQASLIELTGQTGTRITAPAINRQYYRPQQQETTPGGLFILTNSQVAPIITQELVDLDGITNTIAANMPQVNRLQPQQPRALPPATQQAALISNPKPVRATLSSIYNDSSSRWLHRSYGDPEPPPSRIARATGFEFPIPQPTGSLKMSPECADHIMAENERELQEARERQQQQGEGQGTNAGNTTHFT